MCLSGLVVGFAMAGVGYALDPPLNHAVDPLDDRYRGILSRPHGWTAATRKLITRRTP
jgi:hypothetical protein